MRSWGCSIGHPPRLSPDSGMSKPKLIGIAVAAAVIVFLIGFLPQWSRARGLEAELEETRFELELARLEGQLGAALAESMRSNYERARQLMVGFFSRLEGRIAQVEDPAQRRELQALLKQRDEIITLLARAEPEATQRLMLMYTAYFAAVDPAGAAASAITSPPPAPPSPIP
jgi:hypothetical protein